MGVKVKKCQIITGSPVYDKDKFSDYIDENAYIICADSGYLKMKEINKIPNLIIGDFDSSKKPNFSCEIITLPCEKDDTDTFYCVKYAVEKGYNFIQILCGLGGRFDHTYSNILCLDYCSSHNVECEVCDDKNKISLIKNTKKIYKNYKYFSIYAFMNNCNGVTIEGAGYNVENINMTTSNQFAQSNFVKDEFATITVNSGKLLLIECND